MTTTRGRWVRAVLGGLALALRPGAAATGASPEAAVSAPAVASAARPVRRVARFAIVVGNNLPESDATATLRYADDDAVATHHLLVEAGVHSVLLARLDDDTRRFHPGVTPDGPPRGGAFDAAVDRLFAEMRAEAARGAEVELFFSYSGHGDVAGGEGYVLLEDRRVMRSDLYGLLSRSPAARNHVFVDACKSYFLAFERGPGGRRVSYTGAFAPSSEPGRLDNVGFVLSTSSDRDSHEWERFQGGILSHELRSALRGAADINADGRVTYAELGAFVATANGAIDNPRFRPDVLVRPPGHDLGQDVLRWGDGNDTGNSNGTRADAVRVQPGAGSFGHLYVETARGERILDAHPPARQTLLLHVPVERPLFVRKHDGSAEHVITDVAAATVAALETRPRELVARGALQLAFEQFFAVPFRAVDVEAFVRQQDGLTLQLRAAGGGAGGSRLRTAALVTGVAALGAGLAASTFALVLSRADGGSQKQIDADNHTIHRANVASVVCYAIAAAAGASWGWLTWRERASRDEAPASPSPTVAAAPPLFGGDGVSFSLALPY